MRVYIVISTCDTCSCGYHLTETERAFKSEREAREFCDLMNRGNHRTDWSFKEVELQ